MFGIIVRKSVSELWSVIVLLYFDVSKLAIEPFHTLFTCFSLEKLCYKDAFYICLLSFINSRNFFRFAIIQVVFRNISTKIFGGARMSQSYLVSTSYNCNDAYTYCLVLQLMEKFIFYTYEAI